MPRTVQIDGDSLTLEQVAAVARDQAQVTAAPVALSALAESRARIETAISEGRVIYGINTGFGKLANVRIPDDQLVELQHNLIRSHAAGVGAPLAADVVRATMLLRANVLLRPTSGARPDLVRAVVDLLNSGIVPLVPEQGSVGASGDLAPLSHIGLALMGEGEVLAEGREGGGQPAGQALKNAGLEPVSFEPKEGLAFINGTQAQTSRLALLVHDSMILWRTAVGAAAVSLEALRGTPTPFDNRIHQARPHSGQIRTASLLRDLLSESEIRESHRHDDPRTQDAYSLRCTPQVLGAVWDAMDFARRTLEVELNSSTDNPLVFDDGSVLSGGNFHGQPVAQALDFLAIALTTLQGLSERRVERLVNPDLSQGLPAFLTRDPGLSSGYMMAQITAAALVAESRSMAYPASVGSIPTDANQEDFVPMGMASAYKARRILENAQRVVATELLCGSAGLDLLHPLKAGIGADRLYRIVRDDVGIAPLEADRPPSPDIENIATAIREGRLDPAASSAS